MGKKDDGKDDDDDDDDDDNDDDAIAINCDGNAGVVIPVLLSHRRRSCWREY
jgi:hypothetical protein